MIRLITSLSLLALSACASLPEQDLSMPPIPDVFIASGEQAAPHNWWTPWPELDALVKQAYVDNPGLAATAARLRAAQAALGTQRAGLFPSLNVAAQRSEGLLDSPPESVRTLSVAADYELDLWGRVGSAVQAADYELQASAQDLHAAAISLSASVASVWFGNPPVFNGGQKWSYAAAASRCMGVIPPSAMFGLS